MARKFFYVCVGLFLFALTYHVGARSAGAQAGIGQGSIWEGNATYVSSGVLHVVELNQQTGTQGAIVSLPLPRSGDIADVCARNDGGGGVGVAWLLYADGSLYEYTPGTGWRQIGDLAGGATAATSQTWGQVKDRYRK